MSGKFNLQKIISKGFASFQGQKILQHGDVLEIDPLSALCENKEWAYGKGLFCYHDTKTEGVEGENYTGLWFDPTKPTQPRLVEIENSWFEGINPSTNKSHLRLSTNLDHYRPFDYVLNFPQSLDGITCEIRLKKGVPDPNLEWQGYGVVTELSPRLTINWYNEHITEVLQLDIGTWEKSQFDLKIIRASRKRKYSNPGNSDGRRLKLTNKFKKNKVPNYLSLLKDKMSPFKLIPATVCNDKLRAEKFTQKIIKEMTLNELKDKLVKLQTDSDLSPFNNQLKYFEKRVFEQYEGYLKQVIKLKQIFEDGKTFE